MEEIYEIQLDGAVKRMNQLITNYKKDSPSRKNLDYLKKKKDKTADLIVEIGNIDKKLNNFQVEFPNHKYFIEGEFAKISNNLASFLITIEIELNKISPQDNTSKIPTITEEETDLGEAPELSHHAEPAIVDDYNKKIHNYRQKFLNYVDNFCDPSYGNMQDTQASELMRIWTILDKKHDELYLPMLIQDTDIYNEHDKLHKICFEKMKELSITKSGNNSENKLPALRIERFRGQYSNWISWKDHYTTLIHNKTNLDKIQKFNYLIAYTEGEPQELLKHIPINEHNYDLAWDMLNKRYHNERLLVNSFFDKIINYTVSSNPGENAKNMHDMLHNSYHSIESIIDREGAFDALVIYLMSNKLDKGSRHQFETTLENPQQVPQREEFLDFLDKRFKALEAVYEKPLNENRTHFKKEEAIKPICKLCKFPHKLTNCLKFREMSVELRRTTIRNLNLCDNCFSQMHSSVNCTSQYRCNVCKDKHHSLLHGGSANLQNSQQNYQQMNPVTQPQLYQRAQNPVIQNSSQNYQQKSNFNQQFHQNAGIQKQQQPISANYNDANYRNKGNHIVKNYNSNQNINNNNSRPPNQTNRKNYNCYVAQGNNGSEIRQTPLLATAIVRSEKNGQDVDIRVLIDSGSQCSFLTEELSQRLNLIKQKVNPIDVSGLGISKSADIQYMVTLNLKPRFDSNFCINVDALVLPKITRSLPNEYIEKNEWAHIKNVILADPAFNVPAPIDLLLGANHYNEIMLEGVKKGDRDAPLAQETVFGWILTGMTETQVATNHEAISLVAAVETFDIKKFWEIEELTERRLTLDEIRCEEIFQETHSRDIDGSYVVQIPFIENHPKLGESRAPAIARFLQVEKRFLRDPVFKTQYTEFINDYINKGHMHKAQDTGIPGETYFLPHHAVINESSSTTKLRVVFDASAKTSTGVSLNDIMLTGPTLQDNLVDILLRWRKHKIAFSSDLEKMFRQTKIVEKQQNFQRIVWRNNPWENLTDYKLNTVTYGTSSASYLAIRAMRQLAMDEKEHFPKASEVVLRDFYVDDCLSGADNLDEAILIQDQLRGLMKKGGMNLRKWSSNDSQLLSCIPEEDHEVGPIQLDEDKSIKALGTYWNTKEDTIEYKVNIPIRGLDIPTKRIILSDIARLFDPLGILAPVIIKAKILLQQLWLSGVSWDQKLSDEVATSWICFRDELKILEQIKIPRWVKCSNTSKNIQLHGFSDASEKGYGASIYCRTVEENGEINVVLLTAKSKVAPIKEKTSIPRLELCAAVLLANLMQVVQNAMQFENVSIFAYTDSTITLAWIRGHPHKWKTYVANRVSEIQSKVVPELWHHVRSEDNPADCVSRGISPNELINHPLWWTGPKWLKNEDFKDNTSKEDICTELEIRKVTSLVICVDKQDGILDNYSSLTRLIRVTAYCLRFIKNCRTSKKERVNGPLQTVELRYSQIAIVKIAQNSSFCKQITDLKKGKTLDKSSNILSLNPFVDGNNLLRVGGRLQESSLSFNEKHPIILPYKGKLTNLIVDYSHKSTLHGGIGQTLRHLRSQFWIINGSKAVTHYIQHCVICFKSNAKESHQLMGNLPAPRVNVANVFQHAGVDFSGPFSLRISRGRAKNTFKGYIAVFVCLSTKAVHLEIVSDLTAVAFLAAFKRFISRRGQVTDMYSDNGTNFVLANKILQQDMKEFTRDYSDVIVENLANLGTKWHFIPARSPHFGGIWESSVKSMKYHLKRIIGDTNLTYEELSTVLTQIEACMNSRPLCPMSENPDDLMVLTPGHFLIGRAIKSSPEENMLDLRLNSLSRWRFAQRLVQDFWTRWSTEYLSKLQNRPKWLTKQTNVKKGDLVLVKDEKLPPSNWMLGRIVDTHPGKDNLVRAVTVKTKDNIMKRPIVKICVLPISDNDDVNLSTSVADLPKQNITSCVATLQEVEPINSNEPISSNEPIDSNLNVAWIFAMLVLFLNIINTQSIKPYNVTKFLNHPGLHFEDMGRLRLVNSDWNIVVYYNLESYMTELNNLKSHIDKFEKLCALYPEKILHERPVCFNLAHQFRYKMDELDMKNELLTNPASDKLHRRKRGLVNIIGSLSTQFFGILSEDFAVQYKKDIAQIEVNENYILKLIKNQTTISDATLNIFKESMTSVEEKFRVIDTQLEYFGKIIQVQLTENIREHIPDQLSLLGSQLTMALLSYQSQQNTLLDVILASHTGKIHPLLFTPKQLKHQINLIRHEIPNSLFIPGNESPQGLVQLYKIMSTMARVVDNYLIVDCKLPLPEKEIFQIFHLIPVPTPYKDKYVYIQPSSKFLVTNLQRTLIYQMDDMDQCNTVTDYYFCRQNHPIFTIGSNHSLCELELLNHAREISSKCDVRTTEPKVVWIQLRYTNQWIFVLDQKYTLNLICNNTVSSLELEGDGIMHLEPGCTIKHNFMIITSQDLFKSHQTESSFTPLTNLSQQIDSWLDQKVLSMPIANISLFDSSKLIQIQKQIQKLKDDTMEAEMQFDWTNLHHFTVPYVSIIFITIFAVIFLIYYKRLQAKKGNNHLEFIEMKKSTTPIHMESI